MPHRCIRAVIGEVVAALDGKDLLIGGIDIHGVSSSVVWQYIAFHVGRFIAFAAIAVVPSLPPLTPHKALVIDIPIPIIILIYQLITLRTQKAFLAVG